MRVRLILGWLLVLSLIAVIGWAQEPQAPGLSLREALRIARENSPTYRTTVNNRWGASREATSSSLRLITPSASVSGSHSREQGAEQYYSFLQRSVPTPGNNATSWGVSLDYTLSGQTFAARGLARSELRAT